MVDFARAWGCLSGLYPEDVASGYARRRDFCYFLCGALRLFLQKGWLLIWKSPGSGLFGKSEQENNNASASWLNSWQWSCVLPGGLVRTSFSSSNVLQRLWSPDVLSCSAMVAQMEQREDFLSKEGARQTFRGSGLARWTYSASGRHRWASGLLWFLRKQKKKQSWSFAYQITLKGRLRGVIVVASARQRWYGPKCGSVTTFDKNSSALRLLNWCEWFSRLQLLGLALLVSLKALFM